MLYTPTNHEPLIDAPWDEARARAAIDAIVANTEAAQRPDGFWPAHTDDLDEAGTTLRTSVYMGAAGIVWALRQFGREHVKTAERLHKLYLGEPDWPGVVPGYWAGEAGILLVAHQLAPDAERADLLLAAVRANADNETNELMWGSPGTMLVAQAMRAATGDGRWAEAAAERRRAVVTLAALRREWPSSVDAAPLRPDKPLRRPGARLRRQRPRPFPRRRTAGLGATGGTRAPRGRDHHGAGRPRRRSRQLAASRRRAARPPQMGDTHAVVPRRTGHDHLLAHIAPTDHAFSELLAAGGELIWRAGP